MGQIGANYKAKNRLPKIGSSSNILDTFTMPVFDPSVGANKEFTATIDQLKILFESLTVKAITSADTPYTVLSTDELIEVTIDSTNIDIQLLALAATSRPLIIIRNNTGAGTGVLDTLVAGSDKIKEPGGTLITSKTIDGDGDSLSLLGINAAHWNII